MIDLRQLATIIAKVIKEATSNEVEMGISNRHIHLSKEDLEKLFGRGYTLKKFRDLKQPGHYAAEEKVDLKTPKGIIKGVRILGPLRKETQVELAPTDCRRLKITPPVRDSGDLDGSQGIELIGPAGSQKIEKGAIIAKRHIHMPEYIANLNGYSDGEEVSIEIGGVRGMTMHGVKLRVSNKVRLELHLDLDEANAAMLSNGDKVKIIRE